MWTLAMKWEPVLAIAGVAAVILIACVLGARAAKRQRERIAAAIEGRGGAFHFDPAETDAAEALTLFPKLGSLGRPLNCVKWIAWLTVEGTAVTVVHHRYSTGSGKNRRTHMHTGAAVAAPRQWPVLSLTREHLFHRIADAIGFKDIRLEDEAFNKAWRVRCENESFAILVLTPEVQAWLMSTAASMPTQSWEWSIGRGGVSMLTAGRFDVEQLEWCVGKPGELLALVPRELVEFGVG